MSSVSEIVIFPELLLFQSALVSNKTSFSKIRENDFDSWENSLKSKQLNEGPNSYEKSPNTNNFNGKSISTFGVETLHDTCWNQFDLLLLRAVIIDQLHFILSQRFMEWNATIMVTLFFLSTRTDQNSS